MGYWCCRKKRLKAGRAGSRGCRKGWGKFSVNASCVTWLNFWRRSERKAKIERRRKAEPEEKQCSFFEQEVTERREGKFRISLAPLFSPLPPVKLSAVHRVL